MNTIYFDCFAGASGDMLVGALIDLGVDSDYLREELRKIPISNYEIKVFPVLKNGIRAIRFEVYLTDSDHHLLADHEFHEFNGNEESHVHSHHEHPTHLHRSFNDIRDIINQSQLSVEIKAKILKIFSRLAEAEAHAHGTSIENVHFHEVGGADAIIDIASAVIGFDFLEISEILVSPIHLGSGFVQSSHGLLPVPAPATVHLLKGFPVYTTELKGEFITPTGAAILTTLATNTGAMPPMVIEKTGYGAGKRDREFPNVLRSFLGKPANISKNPDRNLQANRDPYPQQHRHPTNIDGFHEDSAIVLEANIDDMNPQLYSNLMELLLISGALDVSFTPTQMKKNRPGINLQVLSPPEIAPTLISLIFHESSTIGIRSYPVTKHMLQREFLILNTIYGEVTVKVSRLKDQVVNVSPEYESCLLLSRQTGIPLKEIYAQALGDAQSTLLVVGK